MSAVDDVGMLHPVILTRTPHFPVLDLPKHVQQPDVPVPTHTPTNDKLDFGTKLEKGGMVIRKKKFCVESVYMLPALLTLATTPPTYEHGDSYHFTLQRKIYASTQNIRINADVNHLRYQHSVMLTNDTCLLRTGSQSVDDTPYVATILLTWRRCHSPSPLAAQRRVDQRHLPTPNGITACRRYSLPDNDAP
jgi:hypothetical protein